jgi:hypothetical protein
VLIAEPSSDRVRAGIELQDQPSGLLSHRSVDEAMSTLDESSG